MKIVSEMALLLGLLVLSAQNSSLLSSLIIIPMSIICIYLSISVNSFSSILMFIYVMVFIGGLLVLLVSVASISFQEQSYNFSKMIIMSILLSYPYLQEPKILSETCSLVSMSVWYECQSEKITVIIILLLVSLFVMSSNILFFKGLIRSL